MTELSNTTGENVAPIVPIGRQRHTQTLGETTIQLLVADHANRTAITKLLEEGFSVTSGPPLQDADLFLVENRVFQEYREAIREHLEERYPVFVPVVLLSRPGEFPHTTRDEFRQNGDLVVVDDVLEAPLTRQQLDRRLHSLLVRREQSLLHRQRERRVEQLLDATRNVMETTERDEVVQFTTDVTKNILGFTSNVVRLVDENQTLRPVGVTEEANVNLGERPTYPLDAEDNPAARAFIQQESLIYDNLQRLEDGYDRGVAGSGLYIPIGTYGVLSIVESETDAFEQSDAEFASILAANAKAALDRIEYEQELQERELYRQILSRVLRHNIRNDLNVIQIHATELETALDEPVAERATEIIDTSEKLLQTSENTQTISKLIENGIVRESYDLSRLVSTIVSRFRQRFPNATIEVDTPESCTAHICEQFHVAIEQLIDNAIKHTDSPEPWVRVTVEKADVHRVVVEDNGPGIPLVETKPLTQSEETSLQHGSGTGLWLVRWLVDACDGTLTFERADDGTRVVIELPCEKTHGEIQ